MNVAGFRLTGVVEGGFAEAVDENLTPRRYYQRALGVVMACFSLPGIPTDQQAINMR